MLENLSNPEYLHVLLNPLPVYGLAMGVLALIIAIISRARAARVTALAIVFVAALSAWPVYHYGDRAEDGVSSIVDADGGKWLEEHEHRAKRLINVFYVAAALSVMGLLAERFAPPAALPLVIATAILATGTLAVGGYIASAGGRIRHREFRYVLPPEETQK